MNQSDSASSNPSSGVAEIPPQPWKLQVTHGPQQGASTALRAGAYWLGSDPARCDIVLVLPHIHTDTLFGMLHPQADYLQLSICTAQARFVLKELATGQEHILKNGDAGRLTTAHELRIYEPNAQDAMPTTNVPGLRGAHPGLQAVILLTPGSQASASSTGLSMTALATEPKAAEVATTATRAAATQPSATQAAAAPFKAGSTPLVTSAASAQPWWVGRSRKQARAVAISGLIILVALVLFGWQWSRLIEMLPSDGRMPNKPSIPASLPLASPASIPESGVVSPVPEELAASGASTAAMPASNAGPVETMQADSPLLTSPGAQPKNKPGKSGAVNPAEAWLRNQPAWAQSLKVDLLTPPTGRYLATYIIQGTVKTDAELNVLTSALANASEPQIRLRLLSMESFGRDLAQGGNEIGPGALSQRGTRHFELNIDAPNYRKIRTALIRALERESQLDLLTARVALTPVPVGKPIEKQLVTFTRDANSGDVTISGETPALSDPDEKVVLDIAHIRMGPPPSLRLTSGENVFEGTVLGKGMLVRAIEPNRVLLQQQSNGRLLEFFYPIKDARPPNQANTTKP